MTFDIRIRNYEYGLRIRALPFITMFYLAELKDTIRIDPELFELRLNEAIKDEINRKLANKVGHLVKSENNIDRPTFSGTPKRRVMYCSKGYRSSFSVYRIQANNW